MTHTDTLRRRVSTAVGVAIGSVVYVLVLLDFSTRLTRTAHSLGYASNFFDVQGRAFLDGELHVPRGSLGIEGFIQRGHEYMYFGPFPALLRLPVLVTTDEFDGKLTVLSMALAFLVFVIVTTRLLWLVRDMMRPGKPLGRVEAVTIAIVLVACLGGTSLTFNAALPWVYHDVYAWSVALVTGSVYWMIRVVREPGRRPLAWLAVFATATVLTRTTGGWAVCIGAFVAGVWLLSGRLGAERRRRGLIVVACAAGALSVGVAVNWLKFRHPFMFPLEDQVWTRFSPHRREALEVNGGSITGPQFFQTALVNYFRPDGIRFVDYFPWITLPAEPARAYGGAFIDQSYRTGSVTSFMPLQLVLTAIAALAVLRPRAGLDRRILRLALLTTVLVTGGVMAYGYLAYRYTCEFVPALVLGSIIGVCALNNWLADRRPAVGRVLVPVLAAVTGFSVVANVLTGYSTAAMTAGGPELVRYLELQSRWSWPGDGPPITRSDDPPSGGSTDDLHIEGDCDGLYVNSGDFDREWRPAERRAVVVVISFEPDFGQVSARLASLGSERERWIRLDTRRDHHARIVIMDEGSQWPGPWFEVRPTERVRVGVGVEPEFGYAEVSSQPGGFIGYVRAFSLDGNGIAQPNDPQPDFSNTPVLDESGIHISSEPGIEPPLCRRLITQADAASPGGSGG